MKTVLLVDDHPVFRKGLRFLLEDEEDVRVVGEAGTVSDALALVMDLCPDAVVMDVSLPESSGIEATRRIKAALPRTVVVALSIHSEKQFVQDMLEAGAAGYILKESAPEELTVGIRAVLRGEGYLSPAIAGIVVSDYVRVLSSEGRERLSESVLRTKFRRPSLPEDFVQRPRLLEMLDRGGHLPLTLVSAPAGYGKTCLVSSWLETCTCPAAWLTLDAGDNEPQTFLTYLTTAIESACPGSLRQTREMASTLVLPPAPLLAANLVNELDAIDTDFVMVIDDFQFIREPSILEILTEWLRHPPSRVHLVLITRKDPILPTAKLRANGQIMDVRIQNLGFLAEETAAFLRNTLHRPVDLAAAQEWTRDTEGWIGGLRLAALSVRQSDGGSILKRLPADTENVAEYLFNEVVAQQTGAVRSYLEAVSILDRFCAPLCTALCWQSPNENQIAAPEFLAYLRRENLFIISLEKSGYWFRLHHLFRDLLRKQLALNATPEEVAGLHARASAWFSANGLVEEAISHALQAGDTPSAVRLFGDCRLDLLCWDKWTDVERMLALFPEEVIHQHPELLLSRLWVQTYRYESGAIVALAAEAAELLRGRPDAEELLGEVEHFAGMLAVWQNDGAGSIRHLENALRLIPERHIALRSRSEVSYGLGCQMLGRKDEAIGRLSSLLQRHGKDTNRAASRYLGAIAFLQVIAGELPLAMVTTHTLHADTEAHDYEFGDGWAHYLRGVIHFYQNELDEAINQFREMLEGRFVVHSRAAADGMTGLTLAYSATGQRELAHATVDALEDFMLSLNGPGHSLAAQSCRVRLAIREGKGDPLAGWPPLPDLVSENLAFWLDSPNSTYSRALLADGTAAHLEVCISRLEEAVHICASFHNVCQQILLLPLLAAAFEMQGRPDEACDTLEKALNLARPGGWIRPFVDVGDGIAGPLERLAQRYGRSGQIDSVMWAIERERAAQSIASSGQPATRPDVHPLPSGMLLEALTWREQAILELLGRQRYNKEIAVELHISAETVKTHVTHILRKLDVGSRREAISKARRLGLLQSESKPDV